MSLSSYRTESTKPHSTSYKQIYMNWMHEKYLRNQELDTVEKMYMKSMSRVACGMRCGPPRYPVRPASKGCFTIIGGFKQHPNESEDM